MPSCPSNRWLMIGVALATTFLASRSDAFCRTTTERAPPDFDGGGSCWDKGKPLFWKNACVGFSIQKADGKKVTAAHLGEVFTKAVNEWTSVSCGGGGKPSIEIKQLSSSTVDAVAYNSGKPNVNIVLMRDDKWTYQGGESLALTTLVFDPSTGEIFDGDIEINTAETDFTIADPVAPSGYDLQTILAHQVGHFLGFAHSSTEKSPMQMTYSPGSTDGRTLQSDDIAGLCEVYAPGGARKTSGGAVTAEACDPTPRGGLELTPNPPDSSCSMSRALTWSGSLVPALAGLVLLARRRRR